MFNLTTFIPLTRRAATGLCLSVLFCSAVTAHEAEHEHADLTPRVVSAGAGITELIFALGAEDELVAVDSTSQLPTADKDIAKLGYHRMLSAEGILALSPSMVIGSDAMGPKTTLEVLSAADVNVVQLPSANSQSQLFSNIDKMGKLLHKEAQASALKSKLTQSFLDIETKKQQIASKGNTPTILFLLLQPDRPARVGGDNTAADIIIKLAGGKNIAGFSGYKSVSQEGILALDPDVILISSRSGNHAVDPVSTLLKDMPLLAHTSAGKHKQIQNLKPQALLGGLGISAIAEANSLASDLIKVKY
ncbi:ABC transporter substrate-binding protein [Shewanella sp.]|nr:ABC transporter substrate-binding protein [Shewanella sp.]